MAVTDVARAHLHFLPVERTVRCAWLDPVAGIRLFISAEGALYSLPPFGLSKRASPLTLVFAAEEARLVARGLSDFQALEDEPFSFPLPESAFKDLGAPDRDSKDLLYSARLLDGNDLPHWLKFDARSGTFSGTPGCDDVGALSVVVTASDHDGASVSSGFVLSIAGTGTISSGVNRSAPTSFGDPTA